MDRASCHGTVLSQTQLIANRDKLNGAIVADDPKLEVNVHGRRHAGVFRKLQGIQPPNYLPSPAQATNLPRFLVLSCPLARHAST
jgi:hypothetical protein